MGISEATTTAVAGIALGGVGLVLGQSDDSLYPTTSNWLNAGGGLVSLGFAVWYAWWVTTKTIPERDKTHAETIAGLVKEFRDETKEQRQVHIAAVDKIDNSLDKLASVIERTAKS